MYPGRKFHKHAAIFLMRGEERIERGHHGREIWVALRRDVRTTAQAAAQGFEIKLLRIGKLVRQKLFMTKKGANVFCLWIRIFYPRLIRAEAYQQLFITHRKASC